MSYFYDIFLYMCSLLYNFIDILVWTNDDVMNWVNSIGINEYAINLVNSGVHGGLIALDNTFDYERLAMALQIATSDTTVR